MNQNFSPKGENFYTYFFLSFFFLGVVFLSVYITEAHAKNEWPCGKTLSFCNQPETTSERCALARRAQQETSLTFPFLVDPIENQFEESYASWPFRYYCFQNGKLSFKPQPNTQHYAYLIEELEQWLERITSN